MSDDTPLPTFIAFEIPSCASAKFTFSPTTLADVGSKSIKLDRGSSGVDTFPVTVTAAYPAFLSKPSDLDLYLGTTKRLTLPLANEGPSTPVTSITAELSGGQPLPSFMTFSNYVLTVEAYREMTATEGKIEVYFKLSDG